MVWVLVFGLEARARVGAAVGAEWVEEEIGTTVEDTESDHKSETAQRQG